MARVRSGGHDSVLRIALARSGLNQVEPPENHRRRYGLAFFERAQTRAEDVSAKERATHEARRERRVPSELTSRSGAPDRASRLCRRLRDNPLARIRPLPARNRRRDRWTVAWPAGG